MGWLNHWKPPTRPGLAQHLAAPRPVLTSRPRPIRALRLLRCPHPRLTTCPCPCPCAVTETDKASEEVVVAAIREAFPEHAVLGEEGGVLGDVKSEYLWWVPWAGGPRTGRGGGEGRRRQVGIR